jgi:hypothetical protein
MNLRHAAALALVGWYLMLPPTRFDSSKVFQLRPRAPLSEWETVSSFDSAKDCETARTNYDLDDLYKQSQKPRYKDDLRPMLTRKDISALMGVAVCIATDDPRLKEK